MSDRPTWRPNAGDIPAHPGVYRFSDTQGRVIYVGKAKNLRNRLSTYFQNINTLHPRTRQMVTTAASVQWTLVANEIEALTLEFTWIKEFDPRFNVMYRDDKTYPYFAVSMGEEYPRAQITRKRGIPGTRYFGPYTKVWAIRETMDLMLKAFPIRSCSKGVFRRAQSQGRPCLLGPIGKCSAPCVGWITQEAHRDLALGLCDFMDGRESPVIKQLEEDMRTESTRLNYERAAVLRDQINALQTVLEKNVMAFDDGRDTDVFALIAGELDAAVYLFHIRGGRIRGARGWVVDRGDDHSPEDLMAVLLEQLYGDISPEQNPILGRPKNSELVGPVSVDDIAHTPTTAIPREILVSHMPEDVNSLVQWLTQIRGGKVTIRVPQRGQDASLMRTVSDNARQVLQQQHMRRTSDLTYRAQALDQLAEYLNLGVPPLRIECYDVSHTSGTFGVASMVVFEDGAPRKNAYRAFNVLDEDGRPPDDTAAMSQILRRRFKRLLSEEHGIKGEDEEGIAFESGLIDNVTGKARRFSYRPDLIVVDGALPQVHAARKALDDVGIDIPVVGLAKRLEELWVPDQEFPLILPRTSQALFLLQYLRDESHRFAISKHRARRGKGQTRSILDGVPGLGPVRQKALLKYFGSVKRLHLAQVDEIALVPGIGSGIAKVIHEHLHDAYHSQTHDVTRPDQDDDRSVAPTGGSNEIIDEENPDEPT